MITRIVVFFYCLGVGMMPAKAQLPPIGSWRDHLPYHQAIAVQAAGDRLWCATPYSLFSVDPTDKTINRLSRINGLSETGISATGFDQSTGKLLIAYTSSNIDIRAGDNIVNIPDVKRSGLTTGIHRIDTYNGRAYLSTSLGIIVVDENKSEVRDTYIIGSNGDTVAVNAVAADNTYFYAATNEGLKRATAGSPDLADYHNWSLIDPGACDQVFIFGGSVLTVRRDTVFRLNGGPLYANGWAIKNCSVAGDRLLICQQRSDSGIVVVMDANGVVMKTVQGLTAPRQATIFDDQVWIADSVGGLITDAHESYVPSSPWSLSTGDMITNSATLWTAGDDGLSRLNADGTWLNFRAPEFTVFDTVQHFAALAFSARDSSIWAGSLGQGLLQWRPGNGFSRFGSGVITGAAFDVDGNGWFAASNQLLQRKPDGSFSSFPLNAAMTGQLITDDNKQVWVVLPGGSGLACYSPATNQWKFYRNGTGQGNLPDNNVYSIAKDRSGFIWVGTANGIGVIRCARSVFAGAGCEAIWPVVQYDNFAGYLFSGQLVQAIAVDGADRKWIGTPNGVWLVSPDAQKIIYHFTADSTSLLNNDVRKIVVDQQSGEVFFATAMGICSFRSTATEGGSKNSNVLVFPNPVPPGYNGTIAIRGLVDGAIVKITDLSGRLIYQTNALGGQAVWNGLDYRGRRISTGVYLVLISDEKRNEQTSTKIVFIGK